MIKETKRTIEVSGHTIEVLIMVTVLEESAEAYAEDLEAEDRATFLESVKQGKGFVGCVFVNACALGIEGTDSISGCALVPNNMFDSKPFEDSVREVIQEYKLEDNAIEDLVGYLTKEYSRLVAKAEPFKKFAKEAV